MALVNPVGRSHTITPKNDGDIFVLGNTSNESDVGGWKIWLMPDQSGFTGTIYLLRRPEGKEVSDNAVGFSPSPYRQIVVNGVAADCTFVNAGLTGVCEVQVEANGSSIAYMVSCSAGSASVRSRPFQGSGAF